MRIGKRSLLTAVLLVGLVLIQPLRRITSAQTVVTSIPMTLSTQMVAVDPTRNRIFVGQQNSFGNPGFEVVAIDGVTSGILAAIPVPGFLGEYGIAANEVTGRIYAANGTGVVVIDANALSVLSTIGLPTGCTSVAVNTATNRIYANFGPAGLAVIDGTSQTVLSTIALPPSPLGSLQVDPVRNRIYAAHRGFFSVVDGTSNSLLTTVPVSGFDTLTMAMDPGLGQLYFAQVTLAPPANLFILDASTYATLATLTIGSRTEGLAVDTSTHRVYAASGNNLFPFIGVTVVDGASRTVMGFVPTTGPLGRAAAANSTTHRTYIADGVTEPNSNVVVIEDAPPEADLAISESVSPSTAVTGSVVTFTTTVTNNGPGDALNVTATDNLPAETLFVSCSSTSGGVCGGSGNNATVTFGLLTAGASASMTITATVNCSALDGLVITNTATVASSTADPVSANNSATAVLTTSNPPPIITLLGGNPMAVECHSTFADPGATASGHCAGDLSSRISASGIVNANAPGSYARSYTVSDGVSTSTVTRAVNVIDTTPPAILACAANRTISVGANCQAAIPDLTGSVVATDNCSAVTVTQSPAAGGIVGLGATVVVLTAKDVAGNVSTCAATVTMIDAENPTIICPASQTVEFTSDAGAVVNYPGPSAADNCPGVTASCSPPSGSTFRIGVTTVTCTATDASGNKATCSFTITVLGSQGVKRDVLNELIALRATITDKDDANKLDEAIEHLTASLSPSLWIDQTHLQPGGGEKAFDEEKEAVNSLMALIRDQHSSISPSTLLGFIGRIVRGDRELAQAAINAAVAAHLDAGDIEKANDELVKGDEDSGVGRFVSAIEHYGQAWRRIQAAQAHG
jgi:uncharacterized repeat protein (TIGR01451 family)